MSSAKKASAKKAEEAAKKQRAVWLQLFVDEHYGFDLASLTKAEIDSLSAKIAEFASLDVDTDDLKPADEYSQVEVKRAGYRR